MAGFLWLGHGGPTHKTVCWHSDNSGVQVSVSANGQTFQAPAVTSSGLANNVAVSVTGLSADTEYPFTVYEDGVLVYSSDGSRADGALYPHLRTHPLIGTGFKVAWISCHQAQMASPVMPMILRDTSILALYSLGDTPYADDPGATYWGVTWATISGTPTFANWSKVFEAWHRNPYIQKTLRAVEFYRAWNDHELEDNFDPSSAMYTNLSTGQDVMRAWSIGNPANTDAGIDSGALYFRNTIGPIEHFMLDTQSYKSLIAATDNASKTLLGLTQRDTWLLPRLTASTAAFKAIALGYRLGTALTDHADGMKSYQTEETVLHDYINNNSITTTYFLEGDFHCSTVTHSASPWKLGVCPCPAGVGSYHSPGTGYSGDVVLKLTDYAGGSIKDFAYGIEAISDDWQSVELQVQRASNRINAPWWRGWVDAGENALRYDSIRLG